MADMINHFTRKRFGVATARERDSRSVALTIPGRTNATRFLAEIGDLRVEPSTPARVVIDERTGTVVIGEDVPGVSRGRDPWRTYDLRHRNA